MKEKLKPCPFCGGKAELYKVEWKMDKRGVPSRPYWIFCTECNIATPSVGTKRAAIKRWNRRTKE